MDPISLAYGAATVCVCLLTWLAPDPHCRDCIIFSHALMAVWAVVALAPTLIAPPLDMLLYPPMDLILLVGLAASWFIRPALWKFAAIATLVASLGMHIQFWLTNDLGAPAQSHYQMWTNLAFIALLACASFPAISNVATDLVDRVLLGRHYRGRSSRMAGRP